MDAKLDHEGATWSFGGSSLAVLFALMAILAGIPTMLLPYPIGLAAMLVICPISALVILQNLTRTTISVSSRAVIIERRTINRVQREMVRIDEILSHQVSQNKNGDYGLVLKTRSETVVVGSAQDKSHLDWLSGVLTLARSLSVEREQREGREWGFLRKVPEALQRVRDTD